MSVESPICRCDQIKAGMIFISSGVDWKVLRRGTYAIIDGKRMSVDNSRRNKWYVQPVDKSSPPLLACFDQLFDPDLWKFRKP